MPWESVSNQFSPLSQSGSVDYWQQAIFFRKSQIAYMLFQQQQQTELLGSARNAPALHQHRAVGWTWTLITHHLCANHIFLSFFRPPTHESVLVSIATGLVPPSFALVSSPPLLHKNPAYSAQRVKWLLSNKPTTDDVSVSDLGHIPQQTTTTGTNEEEKCSCHHLTACF